MKEIRKESSLKIKTEQIKQIGYRLGFHKVGIARPQKLPHSEDLLTWLLSGKHGTMHYMEKYLDKRLDIRQLYPPVRSVIVVAHNYYTPFQRKHDKHYAKISRYAWGKDYHMVIKKKLKHYLTELKKLDTEIEGRLFVDTAPVQERLWAVAAGLGWQGKNTNLISRDLGSFLFLGVLLINRVLVYDRPIQNYCGSCTACIEACPTEALQPYELDARRCLSYLTIEYWNAPIPEALADKMNNWVFGCDICQDVCPWNRFARPTDENNYAPVDPRLVNPPLTWLASLSEEEFRTVFKKTPVMRAKYANFMRNVKTVLAHIKKAAAK